MELTREEVDNYSKCDQRVDCEGICSNYVKCKVFGREAATVVLLAKQLLAEMDKPGVWDGAPDWADVAEISWRDKANTRVSAKLTPYTRELPKSRERQIAESVWNDTLHEVGTTNAIDMIERALLKYKAELESGR